jgi:hypothetical protein
LLLQQAVQQLIFLVSERPASPLTTRVATLAVVAGVEMGAERITLLGAVVGAQVVVLVEIMQQPLRLPVPQEQTERT